MQVFARVAHHMGFAAAARDLQMSPGAVSKHVGALGSTCGASLFDRTTRQVALTEAGRVYLEHCIECLHALEDADASLGDLAKAPAGVLRVTAPFDFGECLVPVVAEVMNANPSVVVDLRLSNRVMDMVEEGVDVGIRVAPSLDGRYVARPVARTRLALVGAPEYFRVHGRPLKPEDLSSHRNLMFTEPRPMQELPFVRGEREGSREIECRDDVESWRITTDRGPSGRWPRRRAKLHADERSGCRTPGARAGDWSLLPEYGVFAVYPHRRFVSPKVRAFLEALHTSFGDGTETRGGRRHNHAWHPPPAQRLGDGEKRLPPVERLSVGRRPD